MMKLKKNLYKNKYIYIYVENILYNKAQKVVV